MINVIKFETAVKLVTIVIVLFAIGFILALVSCLIAFIYRRAWLRVFLCFNRNGSPQILIQLLKYIIIFLLTFSYSSLTFLEPSEVNRYFELVFIYRAFNRLFHSPFIATLETLGILIYLAINPVSTISTPFFTLFLISLILHRIMIFCNKCLYILISLITACKNTK